MASNDREVLPKDCVFIAGGGPVGMITATTLAHYGVKSVLLERNEDTTKWPKMDYTNPRSMETFRRLGLAEALRKEGVSSSSRSEIHFSSGLGQKDVIAKWVLPSAEDDDVRRKQNDGTMPLESGLRISQVTFEAWLKRKCDENPLMDLRFGWKLESIQETDEGAQVEATELSTGKKKTLIARYAVGCDGASSRVRKSIDIPLLGGPVPMYNLLIHFRSHDFERLHTFGEFYHHMFFTQSGIAGVAIAQDRPDIFTVHLALPVDMDCDNIASEDAVATVLGASGGPYPVKIDEVLVRSTWRPNIAVASQYAGKRRHVFIAGDAAHQNHPTGGYGMNMGLIDGFNIGWKLAAVINGHGGPELLESYEQERRPVALMSAERSGVHMGVHMAVPGIIATAPESLNAEDERGAELRGRIQEHYKDDRENDSTGVTLGYTYQSGVILADESSSPPSEFDPDQYHPSTRPGHRAPHVALKDGTPIFDLYGEYFTLVDFTKQGTDAGAAELVDAAAHKSVPLKHLQLPDETHAAELWERPLVLVRPDGHVAWRGIEIKDKTAAVEIMSVAAGFVSSSKAASTDGVATAQKFTSTVGLEKQDNDYELKRSGGFQL